MTKCPNCNQLNGFHATDCPLCKLTPKQVTALKIAADKLRRGLTQN